MQSCRMVSGSSSYGKDRDPSEYSQQQIDYPNITHSSMKANGGKQRLIQESNVPELSVDRRNMVCNAQPSSLFKQNRQWNEFSKNEVGIGSCSVGPLMSPNNVPQSYSVIPQGGKISPACKTCHSGNF